MNKADYLAQKQARREAEESEPKRSYCQLCHRPQHCCLCEHITPFPTRTTFVLLMHPKEAKRERLATGHLTFACLQNAHKFIGVDFTEHRMLNALLQDESNAPMLLYPGKYSHDLSCPDHGQLSIPPDKTPLVILIDGTWAMAKKMMRLSTNLHHLPRICFQATTPSQYRIKEQPADECLATIEATHRLLTELERHNIEQLHAAHDTLPRVFQAMIQFQLDLVSDPNRVGYRTSAKYKQPNQRKKIKRYEKRNLLFVGDNGPPDPTKAAQTTSKRPRDVLEHHPTTTV
jgi:DTW domain-containing protein YfiP